VTILLQVSYIHEELQIKKRKWKWIGQTIRKDQNAVERARGREEDQRRPRRGTERRKDVEGGEVVGSGQNRWRSFVEALCSYTGDNRN
jgi:hypothetical protein